MALTAAVLPFVVPPIPVANDVPKHVLVARILSSFNDPQLKYFDHFELSVRFVPTSLCTFVLAGLMKFVSPFGAAKIYLVLTILTLWYFCRKLALELGMPETAALVALPLSLDTYMFWGVLPFVASVSVYPLLLWILVKYRPGIGRATRILLALLLLFGFHVVGWAIGCLSVVLFAIAPVTRLQPDRSRTLGQGILWADLISVAVTTPLFLLFARTQGGHMSIRYYPVIIHLKDYLAYTIFPLAKIAGVPFLIGLLALFAVALHRAWRPDTDKRFVLLCLALLVLGLTLPDQVNALMQVGARTLPFLIIAVIGVLRLQPRGWTFAGAAATALILISSALNTRAALAVQPAYQEFLSGMNSVAYGSRLLPVIEDMLMGGNAYCGPFLGIEDAYTISRGGSNPYAFIHPWLRTGAHLVKYRDWDQAFTYKLDLPLSANQSYEGVSRHYDYVLVFGRPPGVAEQVAKEMQTCYANGRLLIFGRHGMCVTH